jgi:nucleotide-binding universal stress UspA family protein
VHFRRLLVAIDGSGNAELALAAALTATRREHGQLTLIGVAPKVMQTAALAHALALALPLVDQAAGQTVIGSVSARHDPMDAIEEILRGQALLGET